MTTLLYLTAHLAMKALAVFLIIGSAFGVWTLLLGWERFAAYCMVTFFLITLMGGLHACTTHSPRNSRSTNTCDCR